MFKQYNLLQSLELEMFWLTVKKKNFKYFTTMERSSPQKCLFFSGGYYDNLLFLTTEGLYPAGDRFNLNGVEV